MNELGNLILTSKEAKEAFFEMIGLISKKLDEMIEGGD